MKTSNLVDINISTRLLTDVEDEGWCLSWFCAIEVYYGCVVATWVIILNIDCHRTQFGDSKLLAASKNGDQLVIESDWTTKHGYKALTGELNDHCFTHTFWSVLTTLVCLIMRRKVSLVPIHNFTYWKEHHKDSCGINYGTNYGIKGFRSRWDKSLISLTPSLPPTTCTPLLVFGSGVHCAPLPRLS